MIVRHRRGAAAGSYALVLGLVCVVAIAALTATGGGIRQLMQRVANTVAGVENTSGTTAGTAATGETAPSGCGAPKTVRAAANMGQVVIVPTGCTTALVKAWGGAGGASTDSAIQGWYGGAGGYASRSFAVTSGESLTVTVGDGGAAPGAGGGPGGGNGGGSSRRSGGGGGYSAVFRGATPLIIAGGGGGGAYGNPGGNGGGTSGNQGIEYTTSASGTYGGGYGGTQSAGGAVGGQSMVSGSQRAEAGGYLTGGRGDLESGGRTGGGGGSGYYGGGGGRGSTSNASGQGGGGGSGYAPGGSNLTTPARTNSELAAIASVNAIAATTVLPPNTADVDYGGGDAGVGASLTAGKPGRVVIAWD